MPKAGASRIGGLAGLITLVGSWRLPLIGGFVLRGLAILGKVGFEFGAAGRFAGRQESDGLFLRLDRVGRFLHRVGSSWRMPVSVNGKPAAPP